MECKLEGGAVLLFTILAVKKLSLKQLSNLPKVTGRILDEQITQHMPLTS